MCVLYGHMNSEGLDKGLNYVFSLASVSVVQCSLCMCVCVASGLAISLVRGCVCNAISF